MRRIIGWVLMICSALFTAAASAAYYQFYWRWRSCFAEEGRCFDMNSGVSHSDSNFALIVFVLIGIVATGASVAFLPGKVRRTTPP